MWPFLLFYIFMSLPWQGNFEWYIILIKTNETHSLVNRYGVVCHTFKSHHVYLITDIPVIPDLEDSVEDTSNQIAIAPRYWGPCLLLFYIDLYCLLIVRLARYAEIFGEIHLSSQSLYEYCNVQWRYCRISDVQFSIWCPSVDPAEIVEIE